jgi:hypothetical protein
MGSETMYVAVWRYTGASALVNAMIRRQRGVRDLSGGVPGFRASYVARTDGGDGVASIALRDAKAGADESTRHAGERVRARVAGASIGPPEVVKSEACSAC